MKKLTLAAFLVALGLYTHNLKAAGEEMPPEDPLMEEGGGGTSDPIMKSGLSFNVLHAGDVSNNTIVNGVEQSDIKTDAAGNSITLFGNVEGAEFNAQSFGNISTLAQISNVGSSQVQVTASGNSITLN